MMDKIRYSRLASIDGIGDEGIDKLQAGKVFVIGCGALGSMCAMYLAASGVGTIGIADFDTVDVSNLQRQLFFDEENLGKSKCMVLCERMKAINSGIDVIKHECLIDERKAKEIFGEYDFIIDGSDNSSTKQMTARVCEALGKPYCIGGVKAFAGQVMSWSEGHTGYRDLFGDVSECEGVLPCSAGGVLGPAAGVVASVQASEAIKHLTGSGQMLYDSLFSFDLCKNLADVFSL